VPVHHQVVVQYGLFIASLVCEYKLVVFGDFTEVPTVEYDKIAYSMKIVLFMEPPVNLWMLSI
jgi:hypothetical protein